MNADVLRLLEFDRVREMVAERAACGLGRSAALAMAPALSRDELERRRDETAEILRLRRAGGDLPLGGVTDLRAALAHVREAGRPLEPESLADLARTLAASHGLAHATRGLDPEAFPVLRAVGATLGDHEILRERIDAVIGERAEVIDSASPRLQKLRAEVADLENRIAERVRKLVRAHGIRAHLQEGTLTLRNDRFCLAIKADARGRVPGILHDRSGSGQTVFIEPEAIVADGNRLVDVRHHERQEVTRILWELTARVLDEMVDLDRTWAALTCLDFARARARYGESEAMTLPNLRDAPGFRFRRGYHPLLLDLARRNDPDADPREAVVPIDARLGDEFATLTITGPNTGGKTVALKTMGLLALMASAGLPVPAAEGAAFSFFREIHADIGDEQSLQQSLSTFSSHVTRIVRILADAGPDTLVLLDELGSGTDPDEGAALGEAILEHLRARGALVVVTTHVAALKEYGFRVEGVENASVEFDETTLAPTYRLLIGQPGSSNALRIARRLGMPESIVGAAEEARSGRDRSAEETWSAVERMRVAAEERLGDAESYRDESRGLKEDFERRLADIEERRTQLSREADDEVEAAIRDALAEALPLVRRLHNVPAAHKPDVEGLETALQSALRRTSLGHRREAFARGLKRGDLVSIPRLGQQGRVQKVNAKERTVRLRVGAMEVVVGFDDVSWM